MIELNSALKIMNEGDVPFSLKFVTCDLNKKEGGKIIDLPNARKCGLPHDSKDRIGVLDLNNESKHPYAVHLWLILELNGQKVFF